MFGQMELSTSIHTTRDRQCTGTGSPGYVEACDLDNDFISYSTEGLNLDKTMLYSLNTSTHSKGSKCSCSRSVI